jgi:hypothetical protein
MAQLNTPTNVATAADGTTGVKVTWTDSNAPLSAAASYAIQFASRDTQVLLALNAPATFTPTSGRGTGATFNYSLTYTPSGPDPSAALLLSNYAAQVIAKAPAGSTAWTDSAPGLQIYTELGFTLDLTVGTKNITLSTSSVTTTPHVFRLDATPANPLTVSLTDITSFLSSVESTLHIPPTWPNGQNIDPTLVFNITKLAVDTDNKLFAFNIAASGINFTPITGLTITGVGLSVLRTDGVTQL